MNYWKQFAEMLGLELGQEFVLTDDDGNKMDGYIYKITKSEILYKSQISDYWLSESSKTIVKLLRGDCKAVPKPWKPADRELYWYYSASNGLANYTKWDGEYNELVFWKVGNCFKTKEEAETKGKEIMEQIQKEYEEA